MPSGTSGTPRRTVRAGSRGTSIATPTGRSAWDFVSPDLRRHPVGFFLARVFEHLDPRSCALVCYHNRAVRDAMSDRLAARASRWHDVVGLSDDALAAQIRADRIDILFDLAGHTADHRLLVFARRPAPIQISWMGYVGTTGLKAMDYLLADRFHVPPAAEAHYREKILRMPAGYVCYDPPASAPAVGPSAGARAGVRHVRKLQQCREAYPRGARALGRDRAPRARVAAVARVARPGRRDRTRSDRLRVRGGRAAIAIAWSSAAASPGPTCSPPTTPSTWPSTPSPTRGA